MKNLQNKIENNFSFLMNFGFEFSIPKSNTKNESIAIFVCPSFKIRLVQYHQELYLEFSKIFIDKYKSEEKWITFHWLIEYFSGKIYKTNYFQEEKNYEVKINNQLISISNELKLYIDKVIDFFNSNNYDNQYKKLLTYINKRLKDCGILSLSGSYVEVSTNYLKR